MLPVAVFGGTGGPRIRTSHLMPASMRHYHGSNASGSKYRGCTV
jgi:hypothetical protein